jgi:SpoVK/Ycf46/Vps4 family AAA+-type ATPase
VIWPQEKPQLYHEGRPPVQALLLYGNPGTAKTKLVEIAASLSQSTFFNVHGSDIKSKWIGQSEKFVRLLFARAGQHKFSIIFIDEIDGLLCSKSKHDASGTGGIINEFLVHLNGKYSPAENRVLLIGATNYPNRIEPAICRRFQKIIRVYLPSLTERSLLFKMFLESVSNNLYQRDFETLACMSDG